MSQPWEYTGGVSMFKGLHFKLSHPGPSQESQAGQAREHGPRGGRAIRGNAKQQVGVEWANASNRTG